MEVSNWPQAVWPRQYPERLDWQHGGTLILFIVFGVLVLYLSFMIAQSQPFPSYMQQTVLPPWIFNVAWPVIVGLYILGAYAAFINADHKGRQWISALFLINILMILIWTLVTYIGQNKAWSMLIQILMLLTTLLFLYVVWKFSDLAVFCLI